MAPSSSRRILGYMSSMSSKLKSQNRHTRLPASSRGRPAALIAEGETDAIRESRMYKGAAVTPGLVVVVLSAWG